MHVLPLYFIVSFRLKLAFGVDAGMPTPAHLSSSFRPLGQPEQREFGCGDFQEVILHLVDMSNGRPVFKYRRFVEHLFSILPCDGSFAVSAELTAVHLFQTSAGQKGTSSEALHQKSGGAGAPITPPPPPPRAGNTTTHTKASGQAATPPPVPGARPPPPPPPITRTS